MSKHEFSAGVAVNKGSSQTLGNVCCTALWEFLDMKGREAKPFQNFKDDLCKSLMKTVHASTFMKNIVPVHFIHVI